MTQSIISLIFLFFTILSLWLKNKYDKNAERNKQLDELSKKTKDAIKSGDTSRITAGFTRLRKK